MPGKSAGKFLPVVVKNYKETRPKSVIICVGQYFSIFPFPEFLQFYAKYTLEVQRHLDPIPAKIQQAFGEIPKSLIEDKESDSFNTLFFNWLWSLHIFASVENENSIWYLLNHPCYSFTGFQYTS